MNDEDTVTLSRAEYERLIKAEDELNRLHEGGVDSWEWYDEAMANNE